MDVFKKDYILQQLSKQIKINQNNVGVGIVELYKIKEKNDNIKKIYEDYQHYQNYIINMKKDQEIQILRLLHYLEKSLLEANLTNRMVMEAKHEQNILLKKLENVRSDLAEITQTAENL
tara:strand:+ start:2570 stop:2926 length:357 start_codon:yes stop_codon:yes gene_type:complete